jgi:hypothetical protein
MSKSNAARDLGDIADDIRTIERRSVFEIGGLLVEAKALCEYGEWGNWLEKEFSWSDSTANNYVSAFHLKTKFPTVGNLKIPSRTLYDLAADIDDDALPSIIDALEEVSKTTQISVQAADDVINLARLRVAYGRFFPDATLLALDALPNSKWKEQAAANLKKDRPSTNEEAERIVHGTIEHTSRHSATCRCLPGSTARCSPCWKM